MKKFEILEHTADIKIRVYGEDLEALFKNAVLAMAEIQKSKVKIQKLKVTSKKLKIISIDKESLLIDFLNRILAESDINQIVYPKMKILKLTDTEIETEIFGYKVDRFDEDIKAVTYHGIEIEKKENVWQTDIVFDI